MKLYYLAIPIMIGVSLVGGFLANMELIQMIQKN